MQELIVVERGVFRDALICGAAWKQSDDGVEAKGTDRWVLANRGFGSGNFHVKARLSIHGLRHSAARFSFNRGESSFGFEGNHGKIYITGIVCKGAGSAGALCPPGDAGVRDGQPFSFEVIRNDAELTFKIDGAEVHRVRAGDEPIETFGFEPRRATMRIMEFSAKGTFLAGVYSEDRWSVWRHPQSVPMKTKWHGPFVNLPEDRVLTLVNHEGHVRAFVSEDDGSTWQPRGVVRERGRRQSYPKVFERRPGELWVSTWQGNQLFKLFEKDFVQGQ